MQRTTCLITLILAGMSGAMILIPGVPDMAEEIETARR